MQFDYVSDLHVEFNRAWEDLPEYDGVSHIYPWHLQKNSDILVIGGDTSNDPYTTLGVVEEAMQFYPLVLFTDGNHDHYTGRKGSADKRSTVGSHCDLFRRYMIDNEFRAVFLEPGTAFSKPGDRKTKFIGANGWYDWTAHHALSRDQQMTYWKQDSNDSKQIEYDPDGFPDKLARKHSEGLRQMVIDSQSDGTDDIVVVTHTIPHRVGMIPDNHPWGYLNGSYFNSTMQSVWMADEANLIKVWTFGHTHYHCDDVREDIRFVNNARGYFAHRNGGESGYTGLKTIDIQEDLRSAFEQVPDNS